MYVSLGTYHILWCADGVHGLLVQNIQFWDGNELGREFTYVSMGNPHAVNFVNDFEFDWRSIGAKVENVSSFPNRTNVKFVKKLKDREIEVRVWERGCGETLACGTGACAVVVAGNIKGLLPRTPVDVQLSGGRLNIHWNPEGHVMMTGLAKNICAGLYFADLWLFQL